MANDVLLLGDSMVFRRRSPQGYGPSVRGLLESECDVKLFREIFGYSSNVEILLAWDHRLVCKNRATNLTGKTVEALKRLDTSGADMSLGVVLTTPTPYSVVHFNSGLHDLQMHRRTGADGHPVEGWEPAVPLDAYVASLQKLAPNGCCPN